LQYGHVQACQQGPLTVRLALFEPDIPQNTAAIIRLGACLGVAIDIIEPCGFLFSEAGFRRAGLDYVERAEIRREYLLSVAQHCDPDGRLDFPQALRYIEARAL